MINLLRCQSPLHWFELGGLRALLVVVSLSTVLGACTVTPTGKIANSEPSDSAVADKKTTTENSAAKELHRAWKKIAANTHEFSETQLQGLFAQSVTQAEKALGSDLPGIRLIANDRKAYDDVGEAQQRLSELLFPQHEQASDLPNTILALYDPFEDRVLLNPAIHKSFPSEVGKSRKLAREYLRLIFLHELVHAHDDLRGRLKTNWPSGRMVVNHSAVREGNAQYWAKRVCLEMGCNNVIRKMLKSPHNLQPDMQSMGSSFVYIAGERFVTELMNKDGNGKLVERAFQLPPSDEYQLLLLELLTASDRNRHNKLIAQTIGVAIY